MTNIQSIIITLFGVVDKTSSSFSAHGKIGNFIIIIIRTKQTSRQQTVRLGGTRQRAVMLCGWVVKAGMTRVWLAGKTV